jgi:hypothetical protein
MKYSREIEHAALETIREALIGTDIKHEDPDTEERTTYRVAEIHSTRYNLEPCLLARCFPLDHPEDEEDDGAIELVIRAGFLEI